MYTNKIYFWRQRLHLAFSLSWKLGKFVNFFVSFGFVVFAYRNLFCHCSLLLNLFLKILHFGPSVERLTSLMKITQKLKYSVRRSHCIFSDGQEFCPYSYWMLWHCVETREQRARLSNLVTWTIVKHRGVSRGMQSYYLKEILNASTVK